MRKAFKRAFQDLRDVVDGKDDSPRAGPVPMPLPQQGSMAFHGPPGRPSVRDIFRYRYQHGSNLGSIFILEQWLFGSMYDEGVSSSSELDAIQRSIKVRGLDATRQKWETHWSNALTDSDLDWLVDTARCNNIRLPIGYFTLGPGFCGHTAFDGKPAQVYVNAWTAAKGIVARCFARGIGVLIDLHGVPGGANHETHSGTSSGKAELWGNPFNLELATRCLTFIADETIRDPQLAGVVGIQACNEAIIDPPGMYEWYNDVIQRLSAMDLTLPVYISDGWDLGRALRFTRAYNTVHGAPRSPVVVDCHKYWTFDEKDTSRSPYEIIEQVKHELPELDGSLVGDVFAHQAAVAVYIGEYSMALAPQTWGRAPPEQKDDLMRQFGNAQSHTWQTKAAGSAFWTFKMEWMPGWEWGFKAATDNGQVVPPAPLTLSAKQVRERLDAAEARKDQLLRDAAEAHTQYWDATNPGARYEHWRYAEGFDLGWRDAREFFAARVTAYIPSALGSSAPGPPDDNAVVGADTIGALDLWILRRMREAGVADPQMCPCGWEFEHGFRKGVRDFEGVVA